MSASSLQLCYRFPPSGLRLPAPLGDSAVLRADDLWQHTCGELFVAMGDDAGYREFNFSPSGQWAAYDFVTYRQRSEALPAIAAPRITFFPEGPEGPEGPEMTVTLPIAALPAASSGPRKISLTAVLEGVDGRLSYWALTHPEPRPDFHHRAGFTLEL